MPKPLLVLGSANIDLFVSVPRLPRPGETLPGHDAAALPGGKGANQAAAAARLGAPVRFAGRVGDDAFAPAVRAGLAEAGVDLGLLRTVPGPTGQALILLQEAENSIILVAGANHAWEGGIDRPTAAAIAGAGCLLLQREVPGDINREAARIAARAGVPVVLDAGGDDAPLEDGLAPLLAVFSPNETELERLTGLPAGDRAGAEAAARRLQAQGVGTVLVKRGARGCLLVPAAGPVLEQPAFPVEAVDTTGAGDCCTAAYAVGLLEGLPEAARLRLACAAAACCVQARGAMPSMPTRAEAELVMG